MSSQFDHDLAENHRKQGIVGRFVPSETPPQPPTRAESKAQMDTEVASLTAHNLSSGAQIMPPNPAEDAFMLSIGITPGQLANRYPRPTFQPTKPKPQAPVERGFDEVDVICMRSGIMNRDPDFSKGIAKRNRLMSLLLSSAATEETMTLLSSVGLPPVPAAVIPPEETTVGLCMQTVGALVPPKTIEQAIGALYNEYQMQGHLSLSETVIKHMVAAGITVELAEKCSDAIAEWQKAIFDRVPEMAARLSEQYSAAVDRRIATNVMGARVATAEAIQRGGK